VSASDARNRLFDTLSTTGLRVVRDLGFSVDPPCLVLTLPSLTYEVYGPGPSAATFRVPLVVSADDRMGDQLLNLLPGVEQAIFDSDDAALTTTESGSWGTPPLPCLLLTIEVSV